MESPILFVIFKRENTTRQVFNSIRQARPPRLYIAADGPRQDRPGEKEACEAARQVVADIDWPCEVHRLYRDENMGCGKGMSSAITWFFEHEEQGIIIEDDILPHPDFFLYCDEMLEKYKNDEHIQMISGCNYFYDGYSNDYSYYMSSFACIWGWATWRRVWSTYSFDVNVMNEADIKRKITIRLPQGADVYFKQVYDQMKEHKIDTWDYQFVLNQIYYNRYSISPFTNMIENIGMGDVFATHTTTDNPIVSGHKSHSPYPLRHPETLKADPAADEVAMINSGQFIKESTATLEEVRYGLRELSNLSACVAKLAERMNNEQEVNGLNQEVCNLKANIQELQNSLDRVGRKNIKHLRLLRYVSILCVFFLLISLALTYLLIQ